MASWRSASSSSSAPTPTRSSCAGGCRGSRQFVGREAGGPERPDSNQRDPLCVPRASDRRLHNGRGGASPCYDALASSGETYLLAPIAALLVQLVDVEGRVDEAGEIGRAAKELAASEEVELLWPSPGGRTLAWQERADEAERRAREAVELIGIRAALSRLTSSYSHNASRTPITGRRFTEEGRARDRQAHAQRRRK